MGGGEGVLDLLRVEEGVCNISFLWFFLDIRYNFLFQRVLNNNDLPNINRFISKKQPSKNHNLNMHFEMFTIKTSYPNKNA